MLDEICSHKETLMTWIPFVVLGIEYWLGKTNKTKAGSMLELVLNGIKKIFQRRK